ncbi:thyrostimulin beta-5 subunit-like [Dreissena polymorpha]|uniref:Glycoprotein hormone subunit beta domain-containing protein n=1 Tax=Dreissena polymorpha TaxID=45954 RepID=A0A9D4KWJ6_DREPO|nr:thyrostimulin beta-5 subunit-like [Dreissena polymorpha]KAH3846326.1 hypothetical protein DPMN_088626 [Dreissena polymorpha]
MDKILRSKVKGAIGILALSENTPCILKSPVQSINTILRLITCLLVVIACVSTVNGSVNLQTMLKCVPREYSFRASKPYRLNGQILPCFDLVTVHSCWGRCDSYEYGDYKLPFKVSHHPVCTYTVQAERRVRLRNCHPDHPDPFYDVFDATECGCSMCNPENTSCENLNG